MWVTTRRFRIVGCTLAASFAGLALFLAGCDQPSSQPTGPDGAQLQAAGGPNQTATLRVTLVQPDGSTPASGWAVTAIKNSDGSTVVDKTDNRGRASLSVPQGDYCVTATPIGSTGALQKGFFIPPPTGTGQGGTPATGGGSIVSGAGGTSVVLSGASFISNCVTSPPVSVTNNGTYQLPLQLAPATGSNDVTVTVADLTGGQSASSNFSVWIGIPLQWSDLPAGWSLSGSVSTSVRPMVLLGADLIKKNSNVNTVTFPLADGLSSGEELAVETDFVPLSGFTSSKLTGSLEGTITELQTDGGIQSEPLMCSWVTQDPALAPSGDAGTGKLDLIGPVVQGYQGSPSSGTFDVNLLAGSVALTYAQTGGTDGASGDVTFSLRDRLPGATLTYNSSYSCSANTTPNCVETSTNGSLTGEPGFSAKVYFQTLDSQQDWVQTTYVISGMPSGDVEWNAKTPTNEIGPADKSGLSSAFISIPAPSDCSGTNDGRWASP